MSAISGEDFAQLLYSRVPGHYRARDAERNLALLALLRVVGTQAAHLRQDLDALWDNFFIETCDDWVVPYLGTLLGTRLLAHPVGQSNRLDVWNTVVWRRSKGTPRRRTTTTSSRKISPVLGWRRPRRISPCSSRSTIADSRRRSTWPGPSLRYATISLRKMPSLGRTTRRAA